MTFSLHLFQHIIFSLPLSPLPLQWQFFAFLLHCKILSRYQSDSKSICPPVLKKREQAGWHRAEDSRLAADLWLNRNIQLPNKQGYTNADSGAENTTLFPGVFKCFQMKGKEKEHNRCVQSLYMPTSESGSIMHQNCKINH